MTKSYAQRQAQSGLIKFFKTAVPVKPTPVTSTVAKTVGTPTHDSLLADFLDDYAASAYMSALSKAQPKLGTLREDNKPLITKQNAVPVKQNALEQATKADVGKPDWSLVPLSCFEPMVRVLEFGAAKYARNNWNKNGGLDHSRVLNSMQRHLIAYREGEDIDPESGISHMGHIACNVMFMLHYLKYPEIFNKDDRTD